MRLILCTNYTYLHEHIYLILDILSTQFSKLIQEFLNINEHL